MMIDMLNVLPRIETQRITAPESVSLDSSLKTIPSKFYVKPFELGYQSYKWLSPKPKPSSVSVSDSYRFDNALRESDHRNIDKSVKITTTRPVVRVAGHRKHNKGGFTLRRQDLIDDLRLRIDKDNDQKLWDRNLTSGKSGSPVVPKMSNRSIILSPNNSSLRKENRSRNWRSLPKKKKKKKKMNGMTISAPVRYSTVIRTKPAKLVNDSVEVWHSISLTANTITCIPISPTFHSGRLFSLAALYNKYRILSASITYSPLKGTNSGGLVAMHSSVGQVPIQGTPPTFSNVLERGADVFPLWSPYVHNIPVSGREHRVVPTNKEDINALTIGSMTGGTDFSTDSVWLLHMKIKFSELVGNANISSTNYNTIITTAAAGVQANGIITYAWCGYVYRTTCPSVDIGDFVQCPAFPAATTNYQHVVMVNGRALDYVNTVEDRGTFSAYYVQTL